MTNEEVLQIYKDLLPFLARVMGDNTELSIYDLTLPDHPVIAIEHSLYGIQVGDLMSKYSLDMEKYGVTRMKDQWSDTSGNVEGTKPAHANPAAASAGKEVSQGSFRHTINYQFRNNGITYLSSGYIIQNGSEDIGYLIINKDLSSADALEEALHALLQQTNMIIPKDAHYFQKPAGTVSDSLRERISEIIVRGGITPSRMTSKEKQQIVKELNEEGIFKIRGAVGEAASQLLISVPTLYRYLKK